MPYKFNPFNASFDYYYRTTSVSHDYSDLLLEGGDFLLLENDSSIRLEG